jgi:hypothetical protein
VKTCEKFIKFSYLTHLGCVATNTQTPFKGQTWGIKDNLNDTIPNGRLQGTKILKKDSWLLSRKEEKRKTIID